MEESGGLGHYFYAENVAARERIGEGENVVAKRL